MLRELKKFYKTHKRDLPWRKTRDPYKILVSEVMLQQTQAARVVPFYNNFLKKFPTPRALAKAPLAEVLTAWQGLGYNRRAKFLHQAAKQLGKLDFPKAVEEIEKLPGVGHYTARAIAAFAFNKPEVFIETNIRTVFIYFYSVKRQKISLKGRDERDPNSLLGNFSVSDQQLLPLIAEALKKSKMQPRNFYAALMDYGSYLKSQGVKLNAKSKHYIKQSKFKGSSRELRGAIIRELLKKPAMLEQLLKNKNLARGSGEVKRELARLEAEGLVRRRGARLLIGR